MRPTRRKAFLLALATLLCAAGRLAAAGPNLVLIGWDTLRADHVGALGYKRAATPALDALAAKSCLFANAVSQAPWTLPSFMSVFTGLYPSEHGVTNKYLPQPGANGDLAAVALSSRTATLAETLRESGYRTAAFTGGAGLGGTFGFSRGFEVYSDSADFAGFGTAFPQALDWLAENRGEPFFLFVHGYDSHPFYALAPDEPFTFVRAEDKDAALNLRPRHEAFRAGLLEGRKPAFTPADARLWTDVYDEKTRRADRLLGDFLRRLGTAASTNTVIVLLSDHGEELFDHGGIDHGMTLYDEVVRVPLLIRAPGRPGARIDQQVRLIDVFPTVLELLGLKPRGALSGTSLAGLMKGGRKNLTAYSETDYLFHFSRRSVRKSGGLKLISDGISLRKELYDTAADAGERRDLFAAEPARAYALELELLNWQDGLAPAR